MCKLEENLIAQVCIEIFHEMTWRHRKYWNLICWHDLIVYLSWESHHQIFIRTISRENSMTNKLCLARNMVHVWRGSVPKHVFITMKPACMKRRLPKWSYSIATNVCTFPSFISNKNQMIKYEWAFYFKITLSNYYYTHRQSNAIFVLSLIYITMPFVP